MSEKVSLAALASPAYTNSLYPDELLSRCLEADRLSLNNIAGKGSYGEELCMLNIEIRKNYIPGCIGRVAELHGSYYHDYWGFGLFFEAKVATELSTFLSRYDDKRDAFWTAVLEDRVEGSITIDGIHAASQGAHLRWFIISSKLRGHGVGNTLMEKAVNFCKKNNYYRVCLWTFDGLNAARHLYEKFGFRLIEQREGTQWGVAVNEQKFVLDLS